MELELRALMPEDAGAARALVSGRFAGTRYEARLLEQLESALQFEDPEYLAILASPPGESAPRGLALFGTVVGARQVVKVHAVVGDDPLVLEALLDGVRQMAEGSGERLVVCELPADLPFAASADALRASGFSEEGRVPDFVKDGVALRLLVWRP